jgi:5,5'-dehydrodivanillate O-demethylase
MYDAAGQCVEQPGEKPSFAARVHIRSYPTQEYLGLIFAYLGEGEPPPMRHYPDLERPGIFEVDPPEIWPCNFFNRQDNDPYHTVWTHRESTRRMGRQQGNGLDGIQFVETDYGMGCPVTGGSNSHFHMPNTHQLKVRVRVPGYEKRWEYRLCWHLPIDDAHCVAFDVSLVTGLSGEEGERFRAARRAIQEEKDLTSPYEIAEAILAGKMRIEDMDPELSGYKQFWIEDYVTQVGQGPTADRSEERLGRTDVRTILKRQLWQRELKALAEGRPLTQWTSPLLYDEA